MIAFYINAIDSDATPSWVSLCVSIIPGNQDSGRCAFRATTTQATALEAALKADDGVISYEILEG